MPPNILIFMTDQEQASVSHPEHPCRTPNATRLAREGVLFRNSFCPTAHCCPSRATFMTGLYPSRHGIYNNISTPTAINRGLFEDATAFDKSLLAAGYNLAYAGKWHVSDVEDPSDRGWEELALRAGKGADMQPSIARWRERAERANAVGQEEPRQKGLISRPGWGDYRLYGSYPTSSRRAFQEHPDYEIVRSAADALPKLARQKAPWFLFVGPNGPHDPFVVPEPYVSMYDLEEIRVPPSFRDGLSDKPRLYRRLREQYWGQLSETEVRESIRHYWAYCTMEDEMFGGILDALEATGQAEDTLVLRMSDHGEYCGAHGLYLKGAPAFREAYNIATIARWPAGIADPGREVDEFVTLADFAPTFMEVAGAPSTGGLTGQSLLPLLRGETPQDWPDTFFTQFNGVELYYTQRGVTTAEYKYVYNGFDLDELYDLVNDPHELVNLSERSEYRTVKRDLLRRMWRFAAQEQDELIFSPYPTVALAPWGPMDALRDED